MPGYRVSWPSGSPGELIVSELRGSLSGHHAVRRSDGRVMGGVLDG